MEEIFFYKSKCGILKGCVKENKLIYLKRVINIDENIEESNTELILKIKNELNEYFDGKRKEFDIPLEFLGTEFQKKVWNALLEIPYGETKSYKQIAKRVGNEKASRAVGMANNKNQIIIIVPCHRVIGSNKKLVGYAEGLEMKESLLNLEKDNV